MNLLRKILIFCIIASTILAGAQERPEATKVEMAKQIKIYPNPTVEFLTIKFETPQAAKSTIGIRNIIGNELEVESEVIDEFEIRLKVKDLPTGFYFLIVRNENTGLKEACKFLKR